MNKTININLAGIIFHVDEDAYKILSAYLNKIKSAFSQSEGQDEIIADIEARIAELFQLKLSDKKEVVSIADVEEVIEVMGKPEDYIDDEMNEEETNTYSSSNTYKSKSKKRIFRNPDDKVMGGVCSGVAAYLEIDPLWLRLGFVISFFVAGTGFLLYLILWAIIPEAKTTAEKLQMKGERVNVSNIEKTIKDELDAMQKKLKDLGNSQTAKNGKNAIEKFFELLGNLILLVFKLLTRLIGLALAIAGIVFVVFLFINISGQLPDVIFNSATDMPSVNFTELIDSVFMSNLHTNLTLIGVALFIIIPLISIIAFGIRLLFGLKQLNYSARVSLGTIWGISWILLIISGVWLMRDFRFEDNYTKNQQIAPIESDVYYLNIDKNSFSDKVRKSDPFYVDQAENAIYTDGIEFDIHKSTQGIYLDIISSSQAGTRIAAKEKARNIKYNVVQEDSLLLFDDYYKFPQKDKLRAQDVEATLYIPVGTKVYLSRDMRGIINDIKNVTNMWDREMVNHLWEMTDRGLECLDCEIEKKENEKDTKKEIDESNFFEE